MPDISFFIPAYNCASTIEEAVDSIMASNFTPGDELIITNDCSTDNTGKVLGGIQKKYPEVKVIDHSRNKGGAAARNTCIENSENELLFCLDSDNVLEKNSIAPLKQYLLENNADVASFQYQHFFLGDKQKPEYTWSLPEGEFDAKGYLTGQNTPGQHGNYLFTKQSWINARGYAEGTGALDTWTFGLRQAITGAKMVVLKDSFYYHRLDYKNSYWMRDAEARLWSVSIKAAGALLPFIDRIDEGFLNYMLGSGKYTWYYNLKKKPLKLVDEGAKDQFYSGLNRKTTRFVYPPTPLIKKAISKLKRIFGSKK